MFLSRIVLIKHYTVCKMCIISQQMLTFERDRSMSKHVIVYFYHYRYFNFRLESTNLSVSLFNEILFIDLQLYGLRVYSS